MNIIKLLKMLWAKDEWKMLHPFGDPDLETLEHNSGWKFYTDNSIIISRREGFKSYHLPILLFFIGWGFGISWMLESRIKRHIKSNPTPDNG